MINLNEKMNDLKNDINLECSDYICDYIHNETSINDALYEIADGQVDGNPSKLDRFLVNFIYEVEKTINEYSWDGVGRSLHKAVQLTQYQLVREKLDDNLQSILEIYCINYLVNSKDFKEVTKEFYRDIVELCKNTGIDAILTGIEEKIDELLGEDEEDTIDED